MTTITLTDQEIRDISHCLDEAVEDYDRYLRNDATEPDEIEEARATLSRLRDLCIKFDGLYPVVGNSNYLTNDREYSHF